MTCVNCQNKIEKKLRGMAGVAKAELSYSKGIADIAYDPELVSAEDIINAIESLDYTVLKGQGKPDITRVVSLLVIIVALYIILQQFGILNVLVPDRLADTGMGYGMLFVVGLITSVHCIAMCGGINLTQCLPKQSARAEESGKLSVLRPSLLYNLGRVASYTVIGFVLGFVGMLIGGDGAGLPTFVQGVLKLIAGMFMVIMGINMLGIFPWLRKFNIRMPKFIADKIGERKGRSKQPLIVGLLNGLMPCGPLQSMQIVALASGNPFVGALSMLMFSLGTVPLMLGLGSVVSALGKKFTRTVVGIGSVLVVVLGLAMLSQGGSLSGLLTSDRLLVLIIALCVLGVVASIPFRSSLKRTISLVAAAAIVVTGGLIWNHMSSPGSLNAADSVADKSAVMDGVQVVNSTLAPGTYPDITVQEGIPVRWVIDAPEGSINGCNYKMLLKEYGITHSFESGENIIEFTPTQSGVYDYTCWMGMIHGTIYVTDESGEVDVSAASDSASSVGFFCC